MISYFFKFIITCVFVFVVSYFSGHHHMFIEIFNDIVKIAQDEIATVRSKFASRVER
jgi:hypothetical protein